MSPVSDFNPKETSWAQRMKSNISHTSNEACRMPNPNTFMAGNTPSLDEPADMYEKRVCPGLNKWSPLNFHPERALKIWYPCPKQGKLCSSQLPNLPSYMYIYIYNTLIISAAGKISRPLWAGVCPTGHSDFVTQHPSSCSGR